MRLPLPPDDDVLLIGRRPLRAVLARGVADAVRWETTVCGFTEHPDGVDVHLAGARDVRVDVLVGADGVRSRITPALTGRPAARPAGVTAIAARVPLGVPGAPPVPGDLRHGLAFGYGPRGVGVFLALHRPGPRPAPEAEPPYLVWSVAAAPERFSGDPATTNPAGLVDEARRLLRGWGRGSRRG
ncbi:FAD-dependent oxidoreductase [Spirilliplanes yamanashiensis]|uniref:Uncharacterized protein n=1 Tax=Spirilliplanes yamanashiensis TaxID=42233 RepID=A0A8J3YDQ9_9ACTN|nr:hypothetical protein [Spirilliplanes yamanashiensis]MDP9816405.1 2-polyprenyl-6-methoxyphenol hydroxylase-like FAD-dependent oxidoreductase [Spirilliplanes yamanashiensis]GIJ05932.1 hypothetical protein Sya03_52840 [Spirilliplanes yamanashiensis]